MERTVARDIQSRESEAGGASADRARPYLHLVVSDGDVRVAGDPSTALGHKFVDAEGREHGAFVDWRWDGRRLVVRTGRYGLFPVYYWRDEGSFAISPSLLQVIQLGAPTDLDDAALAVILRLGFPVGEDTPFAHVRVLPPGAELTWSAERFHLSSRAIHARPLEISRDKAIDRYVALFRQAIGRRLPGDRTFAVPLSGGRDSRHILLELLGRGLRPTVTVTARHYPPRSNADAEVAAELTAALGVPHEVVDQPASRLAAVLRHLRVTNLTTLTPSSFPQVVADHVEGRVDIVYDGLGGDVLSAGLFLTEERDTLYRSGRLGDLAEHLRASFSGYGETTLRRGLTARAYRRFARELFVERVTRELERYRDEPNPVTSFLFFNRTRRDVALLPYGVYRRIPAVHCPYLDHDLLDFLLSLPPTLLIDHTLHTDTIRRAYPRWASHRFVAGLGGLSRHDTAHYRRFAWEVARHLRFGLELVLLRRSYVLPRFARCLVDAEYSRAIPWLAPLALYLAELRRWQRLGSRRS